MDYKGMHAKAMETVQLKPRAGVASMHAYGACQMETGIAAIAKGLGLLMLGHRNNLGSAPADDGYASEHYFEIARSLIKLLSMEHGRLDAGSVDSMVRTYMTEAGFNGDAL